jgi:hypothetical protein
MIFLSNKVKEDSTMLHNEDSQNLHFFPKTVVNVVGEPCGNIRETGCVQNLKES